MDEIAVVDVSGLGSCDPAVRRAVAAELDSACRSIGFLLVTGHGVSGPLRRRMYEVTRAFFDQPPEAKQRTMARAGGGYRGYSGLASESLARSRHDTTAPADLFESFTIGRPDAPEDAYHARHRHNFFAPNLWPETPPEFREVWTTYYHAMEGLAGRLMRGFALGLGLEEDYFDDKIDRHITNMRAINYPDQLQEPLPGQLRAGAHSDYGSLTILLPDAAPGGLEVWTKADVWRAVPYVADAFVVNIGDLMAEWTNDQWVSTLHRVVNPPRDRAASSRRQSFAFFHQPNYDALIECLPSCVGPERPARYAPVRSGDHLQLKIESQVNA